MKIYRSKDLWTPELAETLNNNTTELEGVEFHCESISEEELLKSDFDLIELPENQMRTLLERYSILDWNIQVSHAVDCLLKVDSTYKPCQINAEAFRAYLESQKMSVDISFCAVLIGEYSFVATFAVMLAKLGYKKIYIVSHENILFGHDVELIKKVLFDVDLHQLSFDELATISDAASFLAIDFNLDDNSEVVEILTYFNFLSEGAIFFDMQSFKNDSLSSEAEKVQLKVIDAIEFYITKYKIIQKKLNNRSKV